MKITIEQEGKEAKVFETNGIIFVANLEKSVSCACLLDGLSVVDIAELIFSLRKTLEKTKERHPEAAKLADIKSVLKGLRKGSGKISMTIRRQTMTLEEFKTLKPGDKVKIIDTPVSKTKCGVEPMDKWCGKIMTVRGDECHERFFPSIHMVEDFDDIFFGWCWYPWMIDKKVTEEDPPEGIELLKRENADLKAEVVRLKARLFDYMDKK